MTCTALLRNLKVLLRSDCNIITNQNSINFHRNAPCTSVSGSLKGSPCEMYTSPSLGISSAVLISVPSGRNILRAANFKPSFIVQVSMNYEGDGIPYKSIKLDYCSSYKHIREIKSSAFELKLSGSPWILQTLDWKLNSQSGFIFTIGGLGV